MRCAPLRFSRRCRTPSSTTIRDAPGAPRLVTDLVGGAYARGRIRSRLPLNRPIRAAGECVPERVGGARSVLGVRPKRAASREADRHVGGRGGLRSRRDRSRSCRRQPIIQRCWRRWTVRRCRRPCCDRGGAYNDHGADVEQPSTTSTLPCLADQRVAEIIPLRLPTAVAGRRGSRHRTPPPLLC